MAYVEQKTTPINSESIGSLHLIVSKVLQFFQSQNDTLEHSIQNLHRPQESAVKIILPNEEIIVEPATGFNSNILSALKIDPDECTLEVRQGETVVWTNSDT